jgi:peptidoglycan/LPS O-acetylase OafA/YrhL
MNPNNANRQYYPALDGLRGLAILLVIVYHNFGFINYFFFGWLGVDLFFVLSGFLITDILLKSFGSPNYLRNFYTRRVLRIFPVYYLSLIIFLVVLPFIPNLPVSLNYYTDNQVWLWTYLQNWLYIFKPTGSSDVLHHLWSLAVEEQFYLLWPIAIVIIKKPKYLLILISTILLAVIATRFAIWIYAVKDLSYYNLYTFSRIDGICIGCMIALLKKTNVTLLKNSTWIIVLSLSGMNFLFYFFNKDNQFSFPYLAIVGYTTFAIIFGLLVNEAVSKETKIINFIFGLPILKFFGRISYGLYVYHWPIYIFLNPFFKNWSAGNLYFLRPEIASSIITLIIAIILSVISQRYFESIFIRLKKKF